MKKKKLKSVTKRSRMKKPNERRKLVKHAPSFSRYDALMNRIII